MKKKLLIAVSMLCVLCCIIAAIPMQGDAADASFRVGYSRVDINPYVVDGDFSSGIMALPLAGSGDVWNRLSRSTLMDDNGDGVVDAEDGLKATCIAVSDKDGTTVLLITVDVIGMSFLGKITTEILARVEAEIAAGNLTDVKLAKENIYAASTHTHNAPDTASYASGGKTGTNKDGVDLSVVNQNLGMWIDRTVVDIGDAAIAALKDRAEATLSRDQLSVSDVTSPVVKGKTMTMTRHYVTTDETGETFVAGDNFNGTSGKITGRGDDPKQVTEADDTIYLLNFKFADTTKLPVVLTSWRGHPSLHNTDTYQNSSRLAVSSDYVNAFRHALEFGVDVTINTTNGIGNVTSWDLGTQQKYRVAFFNSTGGNTNPRGYELKRDETGKVITYGTNNTPLVGYTWIDQSATSAEIKGRGCSFGVVLATLANECLTDGKNETVARPGEIVSATKTFKADRKTVGCSQLAHDAGTAYNAAVPLYDAAYATYQTARTKYLAYVEAQKKVDNAGIAGILYVSARDKAKAAYEEAMATHSVALATFVEFMQANTTDTPTVSYAGTSYAAHPDKPQMLTPFHYKSAEGETFVIGSKFHANYVIGDWNAKLGIPYTTGINVTVNAFMLGQDVAFVTIPGEPFDYYYKELGVYTPENNLWNDLIGENYGKPYILGYANGWQRYFPNYEAYLYNEGSINKTLGSYEAHNADFEVGTGERTVKALDSLLAGLSLGQRQAACHHCGEIVTWQPYLGQATLDTGHYYLCSDFELAAQLRFAENCGVCFDLNGYTLTGVGRAFYLDDNKNETLNIMDTSQTQTGAAEGCAAEMGAAVGYGGGTVYAGFGSVLNLYSGTFRTCERKNFSCQTGSVIRARGVFNMYGGRVEGGLVSSFAGQYIAKGKPADAKRVGQAGAIYVDGSFNLYGGIVTGGQLQLITGEVFGSDEVGYGYRQTTELMEAPDSCVYVEKNASVLLAGSGSVRNLYLAGGTAAKLTVKGNYTGTVEIGYPEETSLDVMQRIAVAEKSDEGRPADVSCAAVSFAGVQGLTAAVMDDTVLISEQPESYIYCYGCEEYARWMPIADAELDLATNTKGMKPGHYILKEYVNTTQKQLNPDGKNPGTFCFDLNGYEFHGTTRAFYVYDNATLNLQDSCGGGFVQGDKGTNNYGGSMYCQGTNAVVNVYGITVKATPVTNLRGSAIFLVNGTVNLYDAEVIGNHSKDYGGTVFCAGTGKLRVSGGTVAAGTTDGKGSCVFVDINGKVCLSGNAVVDEIYVYGDAASAVTVDATLEAFTGKTALRFDKAVTEANVDVGDLLGDKGMENADMIAADAELAVVADGADLKTADMAVQIVVGDKVQQFANLEKALVAYEGNGFIRLNGQVAYDIVVTKNTYLDLNGFSITGSITVEEGVTLYCMDSATDDYRIFDEPYGILSGSIAGNVLPVPADTVSACESEEDPTRAGYISIDRKAGLSFHRVKLQIHSVAMRPGCVGLYYQCDFKADEMAAEEIYGFGVALSVFDIPNADNLQTDCEYTCYESFEGGPTGNAGQRTGTLLQNIMRPANTAAVNAANAGVPIYGRAYIVTESGYVFGQPVSCSLQSVMEGIDEIWSTLSEKQRLSAQQLYRSYENIMSAWELPNIKHYSGN